LWALGLGAWCFVGFSWVHSIVYFLCTLECLMLFSILIFTKKKKSPLQYGLAL
jgi:hypothetical protein